MSHLLGQGFTLTRGKEAIMLLIYRRHIAMTSPLIVRLCWLICFPSFKNSPPYFSLPTVRPAASNLRGSKSFLLAREGPLLMYGKRPTDTATKADLRSTMKILNSLYCAHTHTHQISTQANTRRAEGPLGLFASVANFKVVNIKPRLSVTCWRTDLYLPH